MKPAKLVAVIVITLLAGCMNNKRASDLTELGFQKYLEQDYSTAMSLLEEASALGSGEADCHLGVIYELGRGVDADHEAAFRYFKRSAERGNSGGQYRLGRCYHEGIGTEIDKRLALQWYRKAAAQDNRLAPYAIDDLEAEGIE
jgi:TPR repeat protein